MNYIYTLMVTEEESGDAVARVIAMSEESLLEQLRKIDHGIEAFEEKHRDYAEDELAINGSSEEE